MRQQRSQLEQCCWRRSLIHWGRRLFCFSRGSYSAVCHRRECWPLPIPHERCQCCRSCDQTLSQATHQNDWPMQWEIIRNAFERLSWNRSGMFTSMLKSYATLPCKENSINAGVVLRMTPGTSSSAWAKASLVISLDIEASRTSTKHSRHSFHVLWLWKHLPYNWSQQWWKQGFWSPRCIFRSFLK